jgi:two-component system, NtrC family, sensor histidine kinase KinB
LLKESVRLTADQATAQGVHIECALNLELPPVSVDRQRIHYVFANFITNAIKHSPAGGRIRIEAKKLDDCTVQFSVSDEGPGIPREYQGRIFDRFFRVPGQSQSGAGLGLSIAREIAVSHGGRIRVRSAPGQGSTFYLVLESAPTG